jgi:hypothetical protein
MQQAAFDQRSMERLMCAMKKNNGSFGFHAAGDSDSSSAANL